MKINNSLRLLAITLLMTSMSFDSSTGQIQPTLPHTLCGNDMITQKLMAEHPDFMEQYAKSEAATQIAIKKLEAQKAAAKAHGAHNPAANAPTVYIIPIVFHILEENGPENISDAQIMSEMKILNEDWGHTNPDTGDAVTAHFKAIEGNMQVQFRLAQIDPYGNCTNGIDRIYTNRTEQADDNSKLDDWPSDKYVNVWVCKSISSGAVPNGITLGYAYLPFEIPAFNLALVDGVLIAHFCVGNIGTALTNGGLGGTPGQFCRTLSHEIGHVMNLEHPWGLTNAPNVVGPYTYSTTANQCGDDAVPDTPITEGFFSYCPTGGGNAQSASPINLADTIYAEICDTTSKSPLHIVTENFQNFMDYSECAMMFTQDQQERVWTTLNNSVAYRNYLWDTANLIATGVYRQGLASEPPSECVPQANFHANTCFICQGQSVDFFDNSTNAAPNAWNWTFTGATISSSTLQNPVVTFNAPYAQTVSLTASDSVGNTTQTQYNYIYVSPSWSYYNGTYSEGFENPAEVNDYWLFYDLFNDGVQWQYTNAAASTGTGSLMLNSWQHAIYSYAYTPPLEVAPSVGPYAVWDAITPSIDLSTTSAMTFSFDYSCATEATISTAITDTLEVDYSLTCGQKWSRVGYLLGTTLTNAGFYTGSYTPSSPSDWSHASFSVPTLADNQSNVRFRFKYVSSAVSNNCYIDNLNLDGTVGIENVTSENYHLLVYPDPMSTKATISYYLPGEQSVNIGLYDIAGRELKELANGIQMAGQHTIEINNQNLSNGVYFIKMNSGNSNTVTKKLIVIR